MFRAIVFTAVLAGLAAGLAVAAIQTVTTTPLILAAEKYEQKVPAATHNHAPEAELAAPSTAPAAAPRAPGDGLERLAYTALTDVLAGIAFALILAACFALSGRPVDGRRGLLWGAAGFAVFTLAPGLGLPPELPGTAAVDLAGRQAWWLIAVAATAFGLWLLAFRRGLAAKILGVIALAAPHLVGPPVTHELTHAVPAELAARFAAASMVTSAVFWALLGWLAGTVYARLRPMPAPAAPAPAGFTGSR